MKTGFNDLPPKIKNQGYLALIILILILLILIKAK